MATINGTGGNDPSLIGTGGNDTIDGGAGDDTMAGGYGDDLYIVDSGGDVVTEISNAGIDTIQSTVGYTLSANVENLLLTGGSAGEDGYGNELNNHITGDGYANRLEGEAGNDTLLGGAAIVSIDPNGNDTLDGGTGDDSMAGANGNDFYYVDSTLDVVTEFSGEGNDTVQASMTFTLDDNVEDLVFAGATASTSGYGNALNNIITGDDYGNHLEGAGGNDWLTGNGGDDELLGGDGDDFLNGGSGTDTLDGGAGNDEFRVDSSADVAIEAAGGGHDTVLSDGSYTLSANVEDLEIGQGRGIGNALANRIESDEDGEVTLLGRGGADTLIGGEGEGEFGYADQLLGGGGADYLDGDDGSDTMIGGVGNDTYVVDDDWDRVVERAGEGKDTVRSWMDFSLDDNFENLVLLGDGDLFGDGNDVANAITGNYGDNLLAAGAGNDTVDGHDGDDLIDGGTGDDAIDGGEGADIMMGGAGDDTYTVDNMFDFTLEEADEGTDEVLSSVTWTLDEDFESLELTGEGEINGSGNTFANRITGNDQANVLDGKAGADTMLGGAGDDTYVVDSAGDVIEETTGTDTVRSSLATYTLQAGLENLAVAGSTGNGTGNGVANVITGNLGANQLAGAGGADTLIGGRGHDTLVGGGGADSFKYTGQLAAAHSDTLSDFVHLSDTIDLDAATFTALSVGDLAGTAFKAGAGITATAGGSVDASDRILYNTATGDLYYDSNGSGDGGRTLIFTLAGQPQVTAADIHVFGDI